MVVGLYTFDSCAGINTKGNYNVKENSFSIGWNGNAILGETNDGFWEIDGHLSTVSGAKDGTKSRTYGTGVKAGYTQTVGDIALFGAKAGADFGYGHSYKGGDRTYTKGYGYHWEHYNMNDVPMSGLFYGTVYTSNTTPKTDKKGSWYVQPEVTAQAGVLLNNGIITAEGTFGKDIINGDKYVQTNLKYQAPLGTIFEDAGLEGSWSVEGGYTFNDKNLTTNLMKREGLNFGVGIAMHF